MTPAAEGTRPPDEYADRDTARRGGQDDERQRRLELPEEEGDRYRLPVLESPNCHEHSDHREHDQDQHGKHLSGARQSPSAKTLHDDGRCVGRSMFRSTFYDPLHRAGTAIGPSSNTLHDREEGARTLVDAFGVYPNPAISAYLKRVPVAGAVDVDGPHRKTPAADVSGR
jgi:hypothetical protein